MSSSLSELRNFRLNKAANNSNGANPSNKLATGRKRIRAMSDSSDDEQNIKKHPNIESTPVQSPNKQEIENGLTANDIKLSVKDKEERFHLLRAAVDQKIDSLQLQDFLVQNDWIVEKAYEALENSPKYKSIMENSPSKPQPFDNSPSKSSSSVNKSPQLIKAQKKHKVSKTRRK